MKGSVLILSVLIIDNGSGDVHRDGLAVDDGDGAEVGLQRWVDGGNGHP